MSNKDLIYILNKIIAHATVDGGDAGGPYEQNEEGMIAVMTEAMSMFNLDCKIAKKDVPVDGCQGLWPAWQFVDEKEE